MIKSIIGFITRPLLAGFFNRARGMDLAGSTQVQRALFGIVFAALFEHQFETWFAVILFGLAVWVSFLRDQGLVRMHPNVIDQHRDSWVSWINFWVPWVVGKWEALTDYKDKLRYNVLSTAMSGLVTHSALAGGFIAATLLDQYLTNQALAAPWVVLIAIPFGLGWAGTYWLGWNKTLPAVRWMNGLSDYANWHSAWAVFHKPESDLYQPPPKRWRPAWFWYETRKHLCSGGEWGELFSGILMAISIEVAMLALLLGAS